MIRPSLILKRAPIGWNQEHYDVLEDGVVVGRIFLMPIEPRGRPWMWASGHNGAVHAHEPTAGALNASAGHRETLKQNS
jgi:hypothetical protein